MSAGSQLDRLSREGVSVRLDGDDVCLTAASSAVIDAVTISAVRAMKAELVAELQSVASCGRLLACQAYSRSGRSCPIHRWRYP
jgi:hypothetical protein